MITMLLLLLAAFILGYCTARCSEEERRCETWRDGVRFGATWQEDLVGVPDSEYRVFTPDKGEQIICPDPEPRPVTCDACRRTFTSQFDFDRHLEQYLVHSIRPDPAPEFDDAGLELKELPY